MTVREDVLDRRWIEAERAMLAAEVRDHIRNLGRETVPDFLFSRILVAPENLHRESQTRRYLAILALLSYDFQLPSLSSRQLGHVVDTAYAILRALAHAVPRPVWGSLHAELKLLESRQAKIRGRLLEASCLAETADMISRQTDSDTGRVTTCFEVATMLMRTGDGALAEAAIKTAALLTRQSPQEHESMLLYATLLRISGRGAEMAQLLRDIHDDGRYTQSLRNRINWQELCLEVQNTGNMFRMLRSIGPGGVHHTPICLLEAGLWARAIRSRAFLDEIPRIEGIRRQLEMEFEAKEPLEVLYTCVATLERCYDGEITFSTRLSELLPILESLARLPSVEHELLVLAAAARWLQRSEQYAFASLATSRYEALSKRLSQGSSADSLSLQLDSCVKLWQRTSEARLEQLSSAEEPPYEGPEARLVLRVWILLKAVTAIAWIVMTRFVLGLLFDPVAVAKRREQYWLRGMSICLHALARLRGLVLKLTTQIVNTSPQSSIDMEDSLLSSRMTRVALGPVIVKNLVVAELGIPIDGVFTHWFERPLSCGSMGQSHRAVTHDGRNVIVKIQYPQIECIVRSDLKILRMLWPLFKIIFSYANFLQMLSHYEQSLSTDLNYSRASAMHETLRVLTLGLPNVLIPQVLPELTRARIWTMEWVEGQHFNEFLATAQESARQLAFDTIVDFYITILIDHQVVCSEIHPSHFLFLRDGKVAVINLGSAERYPRDRLERWVNLLLAVIREDHDGLRREAFALGLLKHRQAMTLDQAQRLIGKAQRILQREKSIKLDRSALFESLRALVIPGRGSPKWQLPAEDVWLVHSVMSLFGVLVDFVLDIAWGDRLERCLMPFAELQKAEARPYLKSA